MSAFWEGVLAGYGVAIPVGAIAILIVGVGLRQGFGPAALAGAGAATADLFYVTLAALAGEVLADALTPYAAPLRQGGALLLFALAAQGLWGVRSAPTAGAAPVQGVASGGRVYVQFLGLTLLNPLTIAYFAALILGSQTLLPDLGARAAFVLGAALASFSWQILLAAVGALAHRRLSPRFQVAVTVLGNVVVAGLGVRLLVGG